MDYTIYLIGYGNQIPDQFFERLEVAGESCLVLDIRARRRSWAWSYSAPHVEFTVKKRGHQYLWIQELGAARRNGDEDDVRLINEGTGLWALEQQIRRSSLPVVLLCAERNSTNCHRLVVARRLAARLERAGDHLEIRPL